MKRLVRIFPRPFLSKYKLLTFTRSISVEFESQSEEILVIDMRLVQPYGSGLQATYFRERRVIYQPLGLVSGGELNQKAFVEWESGL